MKVEFLDRVKASVLLLCQPSFSGAILMNHRIDMHIA